MRDPATILAELACGIEAGAAPVLDRLSTAAGRVLGASAVWIAILAPEQPARLVGRWQVSADLAEWPGEPAGRLALESGSPVRLSQGARVAHPEDQLLGLLAAEAFVAVPIAARGVVGAVFAAAFDKPLGSEPTQLWALQIFAQQAGAELERTRFEETMREAVDQYRDLFDEAPIAYVHEDLDSRFISANRSAMRILGITPDEVVGMRGMSLVPDTPEAQRLVQDAFASIGRGTDTSGVVLELRRKNDGAPVFIQWWSRPAPNGEYTRTMFVDITDRVLLEREQARLHAQNQYLQEEIKADHNFEEIVGQSPALLRVLAAVERVARTDSTVLVTGETGTGKELVARAIHSASRRSDKPLIKLNCAALPTGLVESELFGHERGAFSGALQRRLGRFELAHGGTIFLDEVGEMPLDAQVKLLRVLQEGELERVGGSQTIKVDVRVVAATNRDLRRAVSAGQFREDLFYRLNVFPVELPPLRERREDVPLLVRFFLGKHASRVDRMISGIEPETMERLVAYAWPGNVRELENLIERAMILAQGTDLVIEPEIFRTIELPVAAPAAVRDLDSVQREHIERALRESGGVVEGDRGAAKRLGLHPNTLRGRMKKLGIKR